MQNLKYSVHTHTHTHIHTHRYKIKYNTNGPIYKTETDSQAQRTDLWLPRGRRRECEGLGVWG